MRRPWFRPKSLGVGAVPVTWEGWAMTLGLIAWAAGLALYFEGRAFAADGTIALRPLFLWGGLTIAGVVGYMIVAWARSSEPWYWRWERPARKTGK